MIIRLARSILFALSLAAMLSVETARTRADSFVHHFSEPVSGTECGITLHGIFEGVIRLAGKQLPDGRTAADRVELQRAARR